MQTSQVNTVTYNSKEIISKQETKWQNMGHFSEANRET